jgi:uncharacterized Zn finger protein
MKKRVCAGTIIIVRGRVKSVFNINGIEWMAVVQGYDDHVVQLNITNDSVLRHECNCSDAEDPCKHVIAVLYYIRNEAHKLKKNRCHRLRRNKRKYQLSATACAAVFDIKICHYKQGV